MTESHYLTIFRKCTSIVSLERLYDKFNYSITNAEQLLDMGNAADHRRAELASGQFFDLGKVPFSLNENNQ